MTFQSGKKDANYTPVRFPYWLCWSGCVFSFPGYQLLRRFLLWCSGLLANEKGLPHAIEYSHSQRPDNSNKIFSWYAFFLCLSFGFIDLLTKFIVFAKILILKLPLCIQILFIFILFPELQLHMLYCLILYTHFIL